MSLGGRNGCYHLRAEAGRFWEAKQLGVGDCINSKLGRQVPTHTPQVPMTPEQAFLSSLLSLGQPSFPKVTGVGLGRLRRGLRIGQKVCSRPPGPEAGLSAWECHRHRVPGVVLPTAPGEGDSEIPADEPKAFNQSSTS